MYNQYEDIVGVFSSSSNTLIASLSRKK